MACPAFVEVQPLIKEADDRSAHVFGSGWHTDSPFLDEPPAITILRSVETPPYGGDTMWANGALALNMLPDATRSRIAGPPGPLLDARRAGLGAGQCRSTRFTHRTSGRHAIAGRASRQACSARSRALRIR